DSVRSLMRDDVVRQAGEDGLAGQVASLPRVRRLEVAEQDPVRRAAVEGIGLAHGMWEQVEGGGAVRAPPADASPERVFEALQRLHRHRVDHLLMETR